MTTWTRPSLVPADLDEAIDRHGKLWCCDTTERLWFPYPDDDGTTFLTLIELFQQHGPLSEAVHTLRPAPGPVPGPLPGVCFACGGTGEIHGPGGNGNWTGQACGCETETCALCREEWPCYGAPEAGRLAIEQEATA